MLNNTGTLLLQAVLYLANSKSPSNENFNFTLLEESITDPYMENATIKCYGIFGCFSINEPWKDISRPVSDFPEHPEKIEPRYCLFTRYNPNECHYLDFNNRSSIFRSYFTPFHKTFFIVHGFLESGDRPWMKNVANSLLKFEDANVILIDWGKGSVPPYTQAVANIRLIGRMTAMLIYIFKELTGVHTENIHMIGHSLGAHLCGYTGYTLKYYFQCDLGRITGLDPAEPHFSKTDALVRLDSSDALFVDIIHTNAKPFINGGLGMDEPIGHLDFYPNGGDNQPGCKQGMMKFIKNANQSMFHGLRRFVSCDHIRSHEFLEDSINTTRCKFLSVNCSSWEEFLAGNCFPCNSKQNPDGVYCADFGMPSIRDWANLKILKQRSDLSSIKLFTITNSESPFCVTLYRISLTISNSSASIAHKGEIGIFSIIINGTEGKTNLTEVFKERYFQPGSTHKQVIGAAYVGRIISATLYWDHKTTVNFLTWRIDPVIHVGSVVVETFTDNQYICLCPLFDEVLGSRRSMKMKTCKKS